MTKVALAYSGSIDTTLCVHWLKEHHNLDVITLSVDVGLRTDVMLLGDRAVKAGAASANILDLREDFCREFVTSALAANLQARGGDPHAIALGRPIICRSLVAMARENGAPFVAHGCKPEGDDIIRFENELRNLDPKLKILAPLKEWSLVTPAQKMRYAREHNLPVDFDPMDSEWSLDGNVWGTVGLLKSPDDTWQSANAESYRIVRPLASTPDEPETVTIEFSKGVPIALNGQKSGLLEIILDLNERGGRHGVGHLDLVYHKISNTKSRKVIECPAATILLKAHMALEEIVLDRETISFNRQASERFQRLVSQGYWFSRFREALDTFFHDMQSATTGEVRMTLFKGNAVVEGRRSPYSLFPSGRQAGVGQLHLRPASPSALRRKHHGPPQG